MKLAGKVAIITGAGSGIGQASALLFAAAGAEVVVVDNAPRGGRETVAQIQHTGGEALFVETDVSQASDVAQMVQTALMAYGQIDVLFNNAAVTLPASVVDASEEIWDKTMAIDLKGVFLPSKYAIPHMIEGGGGSIINTASMCGLVASPNQAPYSAAKGGVVALTRQMAIDYAPHGIRVNGIAPSEVRTPMFLGFINRASDPEQKMKELVARIPMGRVAEPEELARVALFLASDDSSYITGVTLPVDGGLTAM
ncbi:MAG: glucose 1-dehydrogenase [Anaerolineae bacterium]|jgi:NAD(P)-dependent dehydrogenase (short-subunit alcohol dehydrogenase family)